MSDTPDILAGLDMTAPPPTAEEHAAFRARQAAKRAEEAVDAAAAAADGLAAAQIYAALRKAIGVMRGHATEGARNYIAITLGGMSLPFDRAELAIVRPGGMTPHEARLRAEERAESDAAILADAACLPPGLLAALAKPDRRRVVYLAHPVGAATVDGVRANLAAAKRWLWELRKATDWSICAPWISGVEVALDAGVAEGEERKRGIPDNLAVVERCDAIVLVGGRVSIGMALERDHASACGLRVIDLTDLGAVCPADDLTGNLAARLALAWSLR